MKKNRVVKWATKGSELKRAIEARFGRCAFFIRIDPNTMQFETIENPNIALGGGADIQSA